jgi:hypothetical protein
VFVPTSWVKFFFWPYLLFLVAVAATVMNPADPDLWHRLAVGEYLWKTGHFPTGDTFSYLSDYQNVADHEWGSAVIFYAIYQLAGANAFVGVKLITLAITLTLLVRAGWGNRRPTPPMMAFYVLVLMALLPSFLSTVRCMVFTHIFFALWLLWFQRERQGRTVPTLYYVLTMIAWANLHGGFTIGLAWLLAVTFVEMVYRGHWKKWAVRFGVCTAATLINPFGWQLWISTGRALVTTREGFGEWAPVSWTSNPMLYPGYKLLVLVVLAIMAVTISRRGRKRIDRPGAVLVGIFLALSLTSARHTSLFAVVAGGLMPGFFPKAPSVDSMDRPLRRLAYLGVGAALILVPFYTAFIMLPNLSLKLDRPSAACPVAAVEYLQRQGVRGKLLVPFNYGSYALWELRGKMRVSMDGRYDLVYLPKTYRRVDDFFQGKGDWQSLLTSPSPDAILVPVLDAVYPKLVAQPGWTEAWQDADDAVFLPK